MRFHDDVGGLVFLRHLEHLVLELRELVFRSMEVHDIEVALHTVSGDADGPVTMLVGVHVMRFGVGALLP